MKFRSSLTLFLVLAHLQSSMAFALPQGAQIESGVVDFSNPSAGVLSITASDNAIINWQSFDIGADETVNFIQSSSFSQVLNRILNGNATNIAGTLNANGAVYLVNPAGISFAAGSQVNVGSLVASSLDIQSGDFLAGRYRFARGEAPVGMIVNKGKILAVQDGFLLMLGGAVENSGTMTAELGNVTLASGDAATVTVSDDRLLSVAVDEAVKEEIVRDGEKVQDAVKNSGTISAHGGLVKLTAKTLSSIFDNSINQSGMIEAQSVSERNGKIVLDGGDESVVRVSGTIDASGKDAGEKGGTVHVLGQQVGIFDRAVIDASGDAGGGTVLAGGDYKGGNPEVRNAEAVYMGSDAVVDASAIASGDGGKVILWGNESAKAYGTVLAKGGAQSGDGGFVETSAHYLDVDGIRVSASAADGRAGNWLLDPYNVTITGTTSGGSFGGGTFTPTGNDSTVDVNSIVTLLTGGTSVTITTGAGGVQNGDITLSSALSAGVGSSGTTLTLNAAGGIILNNTLGTLGDLSLTAGGDITQTAALTIGGTTDANAGTHNIVLTNSGNNFGHQAVSLTGGVVAITDANVTGLVFGTVSVDSLTAVADGSITQTAAITTLSANLTAGGGIDLENASNQFHDITAAASSITLVDSGRVSGIAADVTLTNLDTSAHDGTITVTNSGSGLVVGSVNAGTGWVTLEADGGAITDNSGIGSITAGNTILTANGDIDLENTSNNMTNISATTIGTSGAQNITLVDSGEGTELSPGLSIGGLDTSANNGSISVTDVNSSLGLTLTGAVNAGAGSVTVTAGNVVQNDAIVTSGGAVTINADGDFSQSADGSITAGSDTTWGNVTIHAGLGTGVGTGAVTLAGTLEGNILTIDTGFDSTGNITQSGAATSHDTNSFLGSITVSNNGTGDVIQSTTGTMTLIYPDARNVGIELKSIHGNIQQSGSIDAKQSRVILRAEGGEQITQDDGAGHLGSITAASTTILGQTGATADLSGSNELGLLTGSSAGNLTVNDVNTDGLALDTITLDGNLSISAWSISQPGEPSDFGIQMTGVGKTAEFLVTTGGTVALDHPGGNDFGGNAVYVAGVFDSAAGTVTIEDGNAGGLLLGSVVSGALTVYAAGNISQSGATTIEASGSAAFDAGTHSISLGNLNQFDGIVTVGHSDVTAGAVTIRAGAGGLVLAMTDSNADTKLSSLSVDSGGPIAQSGQLVVTGTTALAAESTVVLDDTGNDFNVLRIDHGGNNVTVVDKNAVILGASDLVDNFDLTAGGNVTQSGEMVVGGITTIDAGSYDVSLVDPDNRFGTLGVTAGAASIYNDGALALGTLDVDTLNLVTAGAITKANASVSLSVATETILDAGTGDITLNGTHNSFTALAIDSAGTVTITDEGSLGLESVVASGSVNITVGGALTHAAGSVTNLTAGADSSLSAGTYLGTIDDPLAVDVDGVLSLSAGGLSGGNAGVLTGTGTPAAVSFAGPIFFNGVDITLVSGGSGGSSAGFGAGTAENVTKAFVTMDGLLSPGGGNSGDEEDFSDEDGGGSGEAGGPDGAPGSGEIDAAFRPLFQTISPR